MIVSTFIDLNQYLPRLAAQVYGVGGKVDENKSRETKFKPPPLISVCVCVCECKSCLDLV